MIYHSDMETVNKLLRSKSIQRTEDGPMYNVSTNLKQVVSSIDLYFTYYEPFDENGLTSIKGMLYCEDYVQKECVFFKN